MRDRQGVLCPYENSVTGNLIDYRKRLSPFLIQNMILMRLP